MLYSLAKKNKIALLYLESLRSSGSLINAGLAEEYERQAMLREKQRMTACRAAEVFNKNDIDYAVFKSILPFPATPNDVDIIHFGDDSAFDRSIKALTTAGFREIKGEADAAQRMVHDLREHDHLILHEKDVFDVDIYQQISASQMIYLEKSGLRRYVEKKDVSGVPINMLTPEAELVAIAIHNIIPEMIFTLSAYYTTLYYLAGMKTENIDRMIALAGENCANTALKVHFSIVSALHEATYGTVPDEIGYVLDKIGTARESKVLEKNGYLMPYKYGFSTLATVMAEKMGRKEFRRSFVRQLVFMTNPRSGKWVLNNILWRMKRETY
jgi:hypothetical protein